MKKIRMKRGISLVVLIITIIVMLILVTVIIITLKNSGIISKALLAREKYDKSSLKILYNSLIISAKDQSSFGNDENSSGNNGSSSGNNGSSSGSNDNSSGNNGSSSGNNDNSSDIKKGQYLSYVESLNTIRNPDRGFYIPVVLNVEDLLTEEKETAAKQKLRSAIRGTAANESGASLVHLRINIGYFSDRATNYNGNSMEITEEIIEKLNSCMQLIRENNFKAIPLFAYTFVNERNIEPSSFEQILKHVEQLSPFFNENKDIITVVEAGFLGPWGEMHWTEYREDENDEDEKFENVSKLIDALLESVPDPLQINVRLPGMIIQKYGEDYTNKRVGMFNGAMFSNCVDYGTYNPHTTWLNKRTREQFMDDFMKPLTTYTIYGGEAIESKVSGIGDIDNKGSILDYNTSFVSREYDQYNSITYVQEEAFKTHLTYLDYQYSTAITQVKWGSEIYKGPNKQYYGQTALKYIMDHMGYRFVVKESKISEKVKQAEMFAIKLDIENTGFGNTVNPKKAKLILEKDGISYETELNINNRNWLSNTTYTEEIVMTVPSNIEVGKWNIYLKVYDQDFDESDEFKEDYTIQFANEGIYSSALKANYIGKIEIVEKTEQSKETKFEQVISY